MKTCPNCYWSNDEASRFCENCGADLDALATQGDDQEDPWARPPEHEDIGAPQRPSWEISPSESDWTMAPLPPEEMPRQRRRTWLWIVSAGFLLCVLICAGSFYWLGFTDSGERFQTSVAENATEAADSD